MTARPAVVRVLEREWVVWKRLWRGSVFSAVIAPILFLAAMGLGLGDLVNQRSGNVAGVSYLAFVAPGLMAASAVMQAAGESLWPVMGGV
jgi:lipooligosaccharide transport system permease protein